MTHPDTLQRAAFEAWYDNDPSNTSLKGAFHAGYRAALQPQATTTTNGPPERDLSKPAEQQGVFRKFNVQRTDGSESSDGERDYYICPDCGKNITIDYREN